MIKAFVETEDLLHPWTADDGSRGEAGALQDLGKGDLARAQAARAIVIPVFRPIDPIRQTKRSFGIVTGAVTRGELAG